MTFTLEERDIYFIISLVLLGIQIYQRYLYSQLSKRLDEISKAIATLMINTGHALGNMEKTIEDLKKESKS